MSPTAPQRRRGQVLENALLQAAWEELQEHGYSGFTFDGVARRAGTSRPVLYRRWETRADLVQATIAHYAATSTPTAPDTGDLRTDLIELLRDFNKRRAGAVAVLTVGLGAYYEETGSTIADIRRSIIGNQRDVMGEVLARAAERGEVDLARVTPRISRLPYDLLRTEMMLTLKPVPRKVIEEIVDTIVLPLLTGAGSQP